MLVRFSPLAPLLALLMLSACGKADNEAGPGGVSVDEARALDEAAEMIESRRLPDDVLRGPAAVTTPAAIAATPSAAVSTPAPAAK